MMGDDHDIQDPSTTVGPFLGGFESVPGRYSLEIEVSSDASCLNARNPQLEVIASSNDFDKWNGRYEALFWVSSILVLVGTLIFSVAMFGAHRRPIGGTGEIFGSQA